MKNKYREVRPSDVRGLNPKWRWWKFWAVKYIDKDFQINVEMGTTIAKEEE